MSLRHLLMIRIVSGSTCSVRSAISSPAQKERALMSCDVKPMDGPAVQTTMRMASVVLVLRILTHLSLCRTAARGVVPVALWC